MSRSPLFIDLNTGVVGSFVGTKPASDNEDGFISVVIVPFNTFIPKKVELPYSFRKEELFRFNFDYVKSFGRFLEEELVVRISDDSVFLDSLSKSLKDKVSQLQRELDSCKSKLATEKTRREEAEKSMNAYLKKLKESSKDAGFNSSFNTFGGF